ncbi:MAG: hypothetical protein HC830_13875 [Bacteroidetes bacterium]|nr:hypothetical protein [Bacteroidota bacterium]
MKKTLLSDIKNGNIKSFELVFKSYYPRLCKYAKSMVHDYDASADIVKDVFIRWWENRLTTMLTPLFRDISTPLCTMAVLIIADVL